MKLIRFGDRGKEKPGLQLNDGTRIDASGLGADYGEDFFSNGGLASLASWLQKNQSNPARACVRAFGFPRLPPEQDHLHRLELP